MIIQFNTKNQKRNKFLNLFIDELRKKGENNYGYVSIHNSKFSNKSLRETKEELLNDGILETNHHYITGKESTGYRLSEECKEQLEITSVIYQNEDKDFTLDNDVEIRSTTPERINFKIEQDIFDRLYDDFKSIVINNKLVEKEYIGGQFIDISKYVSNHIKLERFRQNNTFFKLKNGRIYNNFTFLSSKCRLNNIELDNDNIMCFDIHNSFPMFLAIWCIKKDSKIVDDYDFQKYCSQVIKGKFYGNLVSIINKNRNIAKQGVYDCDTEVSKGDYDTRFITKPETKLVFQMYLNGTKDDVFINGLNIPINYIMSSYYPALHKLIQEQKRTNMMYDPIVYLESQFIIKLVKRLYNEIDGIKILTCHDAIYVPSKYYEQVSLIWTEEINKLISKLPNTNENYNLDYSNEFISY